MSCDYSRAAAAGGRPFRYSRRDREVEVPGYITPPEECLDDDEAFCGWARRALEVQHALLSKYTPQTPLPRLRSMRDTENSSSKKKKKKS